MTSVLTHYDTWKKFLGDRVHNARSVGMSEETIQTLAKEIGDFLMSKVDPKNDEERVLKELWSVSDDQERRTLANIMIKLVD